MIRFTKEVKRNLGAANNFGFAFMANAHSVAIHFHYKKNIAIFTATRIRPDEPWALAMKDISDLEPFPKFGKSAKEFFNG